MYGTCKLCFHLHSASVSPTYSSQSIRDEVTRSISAQTAEWSTIQSSEREPRLFRYTSLKGTVTKKRPVHRKKRGWVGKMVLEKQLRLFWGTSRTKIKYKKQNMGPLKQWQVQCHAELIRRVYRTVPQCNRISTHWWWRSLEQMLQYQAILAQLHALFIKTTKNTHTRAEERQEATISELEWGNNWFLKINKYINI